MRREEKPAAVEEIKSLIGSHKTIGILDMSKVPNRAVHRIKNNIRGMASLKMSRKTLLERALKETGYEKLIDKLQGSPALIVSNENPFKLFKLLKQNRAPSSAKVGNIVKNDVIVKKGSTGIAPGPAISTLQKAGLKTRVEGGKLAVIDDKVVLAAGETVTADHVSVFALLKLEPIEVGLNLVAAHESGVVYSTDVLDVSTEQYLDEINKAVASAVNLSLNAGYITKLTAPLAIQKAFNEARGICLVASIFEKDLIGEVLAKAVAEAKALEAKVGAQ